MDFVQELVSNFCHMSTRKCKTCGEYKPFRDYDGSQWLKDHKKCQCNKCKQSNQAQTVAAATGTHAPTPVEQHDGVCRARTHDTLTKAVACLGSPGRCRVFGCHRPEDIQPHHRTHR